MSDSLASWVANRSIFRSKSGASTMSRTARMARRDAAVNGQRRSAKIDRQPSSSSPGRQGQLQCNGALEAVYAVP